MKTELFDASVLSTNNLRLKKCWIQKYFGSSKFLGFKNLAEDNLWVLKTEILSNKNHSLVLLNVWNVNPHVIKSMVN